MRGIVVRLLEHEQLREISRHSYRRTQHNVAVAFAFNAVGVPAAATGLVMPIWAIAAMVRALPRSTSIHATAASRASSQPWRGSDVARPPASAATSP
jgi:cation transport ATPase